MMQRRRWLQLGSLTGASLMWPGLAQTADLADKPIRMVLAAPPGGPLDTLARALAQHMAASLGRPVFIDNRPGASGIVGTQIVASAAPDGHTLQLTIDAPLTQIPHTMPATYDVFRDLTPLGQVTNGGVVLAMHPSLPVKDVRELAEYGRAHPNSLNYASFGKGTVSHIYGALLARAIGVDMVHVPFQGSAHATAELLTGRCHLIFDTPAASAQHVQRGTLRLLAAASPARREQLPELPTMLEQGFKGFELRSWVGMIGPAGLPTALADRLEAALVAARQSTEVKRLLKSLYFESADGTRQQFAQRIRSEYDTWGRYVRELQIKV